MLGKTNAMGGKAEGIYAWIKYNFTPEVTIPKGATLDVIADATTIKLTGASFDLSLITPENYKEALLSFTYPPNGPYFSGGNGALYWYSTSGPYREVTEYNNGVLKCNNEYSSMRGTFQLTKAKEYIVSDDIKDLSGFTVSDEQNEFPDREFKNGYWYEKANDFTSGRLGYTKVAVDVCTFTSELSTVQVPHSLGKAPAVVLMFANERQQNKIYQYVGLGDEGGTRYMSGAAKWADAAKGTVLTVNVTDSIIDMTNSNYKFATGTEFTIITMA